MGKMNRSTRMLLMRDSTGGTYWPEDRFRDRRGREHYDNGRYAPVRNEGGYGAESRRKRMVGEYDEPWGDDGYRHTYGPSYEDDGRPVNTIGFERPNVLMLPMNHTTGRSGSMETASSPKMHHGFTQEMAEEWVASMQNEDGTKGPHWKMEDVQKLIKQRGLRVDPVEFYAVLNGVYSDYCAVAKKHGVNSMDFYVDFAMAWINDKDAVPDKTMVYYEYIAK